MRFDRVVNCFTSQLLDDMLVEHDGDTVRGVAQLWTSVDWCGCPEGMFIDDCEEAPYPAEFRRQAIALCSVTPTSRS